MTGSKSLEARSGTHRSPRAAAATLLFLVTAVLLLAGRPAWRPVGSLAAVVSIAVRLPSASIALAGLAVDAAVLLAVAAAVAAAHHRPMRSGTAGPR